MEEATLLKYIDENGSIQNSIEFAESKSIDHQQLYGLINSLALLNMLTYEKKECTKASLTAEGIEVMKQGRTPEIRLITEIINSAEGVDKNVIQQSMGQESYLAAFKSCMKNKWITQEKGSDILKKAASLTGVPKDVVFEQLQTVSKCFVITELEKQKGKVLEDLKSVEFSNMKVADDKDPKYAEEKKKLVQEGKFITANDFNELKSRKLVKVETIKFFYVTKGSAFALERKKQETDLTSDMILSGEWQDHLGNFKEYNFKATGKRNANGYLHTLLKVRTEFRKVFLELGFEEMATNNFVESSFWNFDALFQPQQHPARDAHDTFFLNNPKECLTLPSDGYLEKVKETHEQGGFGSIGYRYDWKVEESKKNLLRTHTTAVSSRYLRKLGKELQEGKPFKPLKYFSIDRVFRNEVPDATHLCEFHQIEGMVIDKGLTLGDMIGLFGTFFEKIGIKDLKFKPAFNPYTEPSMEIFGYHPILQKWVEVGNSGMFRPEMLRPMGIPEDVTVLAWGLSLERPTMIKYNIGNIRDLVGHKVDLVEVQKNPICRLNK